MNDCILLLDRLANARNVPDVCLDKFNMWSNVEGEGTHRPMDLRAEIIENSNFVTVSQKSANSMAADKSGPTGDENLQAGILIFPILL